MPRYVLLLVQETCRRKCHREHRVYRGEKRRAIQKKQEGSGHEGSLMHGTLVY
jgi:hypothetical protein